MTPKQLEKQLHLWHNLKGAKATLLNLSENHTFLLKAQDGTKHIIRVHRPLYQTYQAINSELCWLRALNEDSGLNLIRPISGVDGKFVQQVNINEEQQTYAVRFAFENGKEAECEWDEDLFADLGYFAANCHNHVEKWEKPKDFIRPIWDENTILNEDGIWGDWRKAPNVTGKIRKILQELDKVLRLRLRQYGKESDRFGLIHADMRLANILINNGKTRLIDFDDCGFGWFAYDFAAAISFFEDSEKIPQLKQIWLKSYRQYRNFSKKDEAMLDSLIMLRRMALLAWIGSHSETELARKLKYNFAQNTAKMAKNYLNGKLYI